jgi:hypothetical protein
MEIERRKWTQNFWTIKPFVTVQRHPRTVLTSQCPQSDFWLARQWGAM